jgi:hypothetical protein
MCRVWRILASFCCAFSTKERYAFIVSHLPADFNRFEKHDSDKTDWISGSLLVQCRCDVGVSLGVVRKQEVILGRLLRTTDWREIADQLEEIREILLIRGSLDQQHSTW